MKADNTPLNRLNPAANVNSDAFGPMKQEEFQMKVIEDHHRYK
jgi:hypothetical protein